MRKPGWHGADYCPTAFALAAMLRMVTSALVATFGTEGTPATAIDKLPESTNTSNAASARKMIETATDAELDSGDEVPLIDTIANIFHLAHQLGMSPEAIVDMATKHYQAEIGETE